MTSSLQAIKAPPSIRKGKRSLGLASLLKSAKSPSLMMGEGFGVGVKSNSKTAPSPTSTMPCKSGASKTA